MTIQVANTLQVKVDDFTVLGSVVLHHRLDSIVEVALPMGPMLVQFKEDEKGTRYEGGAEGEKFFLNFFNHNNPNGEGIFTPIRLGSVDNLSYYFTYFSLAFTSTGRKLELAIYSKDGSA
jgi:hypothetical protein